MTIVANGAQIFPVLAKKSGEAIFLRPCVFMQSNHWETEDRVNKMIYCTSVNSLMADF